MRSKEIVLSERPSQPIFPTRLGNFVGKFRKRIAFDPDELLMTAERVTGLTDWGEDGFREGLSVFCQAINEDSRLHQVGRLMTRKGIEKWLADRLRIQKTLAGEPGILEERIEKPIVIPGAPRSGTTLLHRLFATDPRFRTTKAWEVYFPVPPPRPETYETDVRIRKTAKLLRSVFRTSPYLAVAHPMSARMAEECWYLIDRAFIRVLPAMFYDVPTYREWLFSRPRQELVAAYRYHKKQLQILQWRFHSVRWLLKSPIHGVLLNSFHEVYPDATYVFCHRDPARTVPSACSLVAARKSSFYNRLDFAHIGDVVLKFAKLAEQSLDVKAAVGRERFLQVSFKQLIKTPIDTMKGLYERLGVEFTADTEARMAAFLVTQKHGRHRHHKYRLEQFGLDERRIKRTLERYYDEAAQFF